MLRTLAFSGLLLLGFVNAFTQDDLEDVNFPLNSSIVVDNFQGLDLLAAVLNRHSNLDLELIGHADIIGSQVYNKRLSERRAESVKMYLVSKGAPQDRISTSGEGVDRTYDNATREGRFQNRRVSIFLYETVNGLRSKVSYPRMLELFFGKRANMEALKELKEESTRDNKDVMDRLSEIEKKLDAMNESLSRRISNLELAHMKMTDDSLPKRANMSMQMGKYTGVAVSLGTDDNGELTGQLRGLYFRNITDNFAVQAQGDASYYDTREEGQADLAAVYQRGGFKLAAAGSHKWASLDGFESIRLTQGSVIADWRFETGKIGLFGAFGISDGDVVRRDIIDNAYTLEYYTSIPTQVGIDFGVSIGNIFDLSGYASSLDTETSDADLGAGLTLQGLISEQLSWYVDAQLNDGLLLQDDDELRYMIGLKLGSWNQARYNVSDQITPVNIPRIRYEILTRTVRTGNTAPIADAGESRTDVPAGTVTLDGSGSTDPEHDALSYRWSQTGGPTVELSGADKAVASFVGVAGNTYSFQLTVRDSNGATGSDQISIAMEAAPIPEPTISFFTAAPATIMPGQVSTLSWSTESADEVTISGLGQVGPVGTVVVAPEATTEYTITATNETGSVTHTLTVTVDEPPPIPEPVIEFFTATPATVAPGEKATLAWNVSHSDEVTMSGVGRVAASGSFLIAPSETTEYTLTATNASGTVTSSVTVTVSLPAPVIEFFTATPDTIDEGDFTTLNWSVSNATDVSITQLGRVNPSGSLILSPEATVTYTLVATNESGSVQADITVTVNPVVASNTSPVANAGADFQVLRPGMVTLDGSGSFDADGDTLIYQWTQIGGPSVTLDGSDTANPTFMAQTAGDYYTFRLTVRDGKGGVDADQVGVEVIAFKR